MGKGVKKRRYFENPQAGSKNAKTKKNVTGKGNKKDKKPNKDERVETVDLSSLDLVSLTKTKKQPWKEKHRRPEPERLREEEKDPFPGNAPVPKEKIKKYKRGTKIDFDTVKTKFHQDKFQQKEKQISKALRQAARAELLNQEPAGFLEADPGELSYEISQQEIVSSVDIMSAQKHFDLKLDKFGPYRMNYTRNGRFLLIGGRKGHVAGIDWQTKNLMCEMNVMETVTDVKWLHQETMFAVSQKEWTYVYDNQGIELHCLKGLDKVLRMEFLPYHFLLVSANEKGYLNYLDVSVGKKVAGYFTGLGRLGVMCQNPSNAIIHLGHSGGTVTLWSPNVKEPLVKMLCHGSGTRAIAVDQQGRYMATSGIDRKLKIWDLRTFKQLQSYKTAIGPGSLSFSQKGLLAAGLGNVVEVYRDCCTQTISSPYMSHRVQGTIDNLQFCPFEDVLGVGHGTGFTSLLIPGAGEPNFDALECNPYQSKDQRKQAEVKMLLEKIQPDMISLKTGKLGAVDKKSLQQMVEDKKKILYLKPDVIEFEPRYKKKGKSKAGNVEKRKKGVKFERKMKQVKEFLKDKQRQQSKEEKKQEYSVFNRFKKKKE